jgi:hypothetical protein
MSFVRVNSGGWSAGDTLIPAQINTIDSNLANALDKSVAGDEFAGLVTFLSTGQIQANIINAIEATTGQGINASVASGIYSTVAFGIGTATPQGICSLVAAGITTVSAGGIQSGVAGGITGGVAGGIKPGIAAGITSDISGGIAITAAGGLQGDIASAIVSTTAGAIHLGGGTSDEIQYDNVRTAFLAMPATPYAGNLAGGFGLVGTLLQVTSVTGTHQLVGPLRVHNGATFSSLAVFIQVATHTGLPVTLPLLTVYALNIATGALTALGSGSPVASSTAAWNATTSWSVPLTGVTVNTATAVYFAAITDEQGTNSIFGNIYSGLESQMSNITSMAFA